MPPHVVQHSHGVCIIAHGYRSCLCEMDTEYAAAAFGGCVFKAHGANTYCTPIARSAQATCRWAHLPLCFAWHSDASV